MARACGGPLTPCAATVNIAQVGGHADVRQWAHAGDRGGRGHRGAGGGVRAELAALAVASRAGHAADDRDLVTCMFTDVAARAQSSWDDADLIAAARAEVVRLAPSLRGRLDAESRVFRIPQAMPTVHPGRLTDVAAYRATASGRVVLAGDFLAFPWTDSAAATGLWAARRVRRLST